ncbi:hypothetical protein ACVIDN_003864 [Rhizobium brockwellii]
MLVDTLGRPMLFIAMAGQVATSFKLNNRQLKPSGR